MREGDKLDTHLWAADQALHRIEQDGKTIVYWRCLRCGRDFAEGFDGVNAWEAVYVGVLRIERLAKSVTDIWLFEPCPGEPRLGDDELRAVRRS